MTDDMNGPFKVGDVCVVVQSGNPHFPIGTEVTILRIDTDTPYGPETCYVVHETWEPLYNYTVAADHNLKRKPPPDEQPVQLSEWELCPWRPRSVENVE